jgi:hypothetical protein
MDTPLLKLVAGVRVAELVDADPGAGGGAVFISSIGCAPRRRTAGRPGR